MKIINLIDNINQVNFGVWNAAISTAKELHHYGVQSEIWFPKTKNIPVLDSVTLKPISRLNIVDISKYISKNYDQNDTIIISHGCWNYPTKLGANLQKKGFKWIAVPQGMLEPWSMQQKKIKKLIYFHLKEKNLLQKASAIRAVSTPELHNLKSFFSNIHLIPNGVKEKAMISKLWVKPLKFLFMARLHHKKGIVPLVEAWGKSNLTNNLDFQLNIAGPDDGEMKKMMIAIENTNSKNIKFVGPQYGTEKEKLLSESHFYILPSFSEGFPTSVLEAMQYGLIPLITEGCNFPEAIESQKAIIITQKPEDIILGLKIASQIDKVELIQKSIEINEFVNKNYSNKYISEMQYKIYQEVIN